MSQEIGIGYDEFYLMSLADRMEILRKISAENRAFLLKTQAERWLSVNRSRINSEQIALVEQIIQSISPDWYNQEKRKEVIAESEILCQKLGAAFSAEDSKDISTFQGKHIPAGNVQS